jgi:hypothetical protein
MQVHPKPEDPYSNVLDTMNWIFAVIFNFEAAMKLSAFHANYFHEAWNKFDFVCVFVGDVVLIIEATVGSNASLGTTVNAFRIFRIARLFRLVRFLKGLNQLVNAFLVSLPKLFNVGIIMGLLLYLYAVLGVSLFAKIGYLGTGPHNEQANFRSFFTAVSVLMRSMTGEAWNELMHDLGASQFDFESYRDVTCVPSFSITKDNFASLDVSPKDGVVDSPNECGSMWGAYLYFITYTLSVTFVILNLFIAVILDAFEESTRSEVQEIMLKCVELWKQYDPNYTLSLPVDKVLDFIDEVVGDLCKQNNQDANSKDWKVARYDQYYSGEAKEGVIPWAYYNLQYMRILALKVGEPPFLEVRFPVAVKSILRRVICQCVPEHADGFSDLDFLAQTKIQRINNLLDLEALDLATQSENEPLKAELARLKIMERAQMRASVDYFSRIQNRSQNMLARMTGGAMSSGPGGAATWQVGLMDGDGRKAVLQNGRLVFETAVDGTMFQMIRDGDYFRLRGLPGGEDMQFSEERLGNETYLKTSEGQFVLTELTGRVGIVPVSREMVLPTAALKVERRQLLHEKALLEEVAAAKIQRRMKELLQRRRARSAEDRRDHGEASSYAAGPITRAAG